MDLLVKDNIIRELHKGVYIAPVKSKDIEVKYDITGEEIRSLVRELRRSHVPLVESTLGGYYIAKTSQEFFEGWTEFRKRFQSMLKTDAEMKVTYEEMKEKELKCINQMEMF